ncbi:MAG: hypothetical protein NC541_06660 [bacterium]|nr:hypothetical protein [bacterium]
MGAPDVALGVYMNDPDRIRSVLEYYLGEKLPGDWEYQELKGLYPVRNSKGKLTHRQRDLIGNAYAWGTGFLLGLENQEKINLIFPWRLMKLDCLAYRHEIEKACEKNRDTGKRYGEEDDFLYRYGKEVRVKPVLSLMLYWGKKNWKRPLSLREMTEDISALPPKLQQLAGDYRVSMIHMRQIPEEALQEMDSDLKYVLGIMKYTRSSRKYESYIRENREFFERIPRSALDVIDVCTNIKDIRKHLRFVLAEGKEEEEADMCYALDQIQRNAEKKGRKQGQKEGRQEGLRRGKQEGIRQGKQEGLRQGMQEGIQQMSELIRRLLADGRQEELAQAATDVMSWQKLLAEYRLEG